MTNLRYIKFFEAFESQKLSKTLGFIKTTREKEQFLEKLKRICNSIDFPYSKLSDDFFEYLPFKRALEANSIYTDEPCEATSQSEFPEHSIEGEKCDGGKIKRMWGSRVRQVVCPVCNGTGIKPKKSEIKLIKFWFDKEGEFVATTAVDGITRSGQKKHSSGRFSKEFSRTLSDYYLSSEVLSHDQVRQLKTGDIVRVTINRTETIAMIYRENGNVYALQDEHDGSRPNANTRSTARYCWSLARGEYRNCRLLTPKSKPKESEEEFETEVDPYTWNVSLSFNYRNFAANSSEDVYSMLKPAHFAIVMDFGKIKKSGFTTTYQLRSEREESKQGSKIDPSMTDEEIKRKNIERYIAQISKNIDISSDVANCTKLITRGIGSRAALYIILSQNIVTEFGRVIYNYSDLLKASTDEEKQQEAEELERRVREIYKTGSKKSLSILNKVDEIKKNILNYDNLTDDQKKLRIALLTRFQELSDKFLQKLQSLQVDCIEDFEIINQKINSLKNIFNSDRFSTSRFRSYFIDYLGSGNDRSQRYLVDSYYFSDDTCQNILKDFDSLEKVIDRI